MMITTAVLAIMVGTVMPATQTSDRTLVLGAARMVISDIQFAQVRSITEPTNPTALTVAADQSGYWIAEAKTLSEPISIPDGAVGAGDAYEVVFGGYRAIPFEGVRITLATQGVPRSLTFDQYGRLTSTTDVVLTVTSRKQSIQITVNALTGSVSIE
ncbi:MAG: hypothetical protein KAS72_07075 [Phycisphaerales bacterium]|nr:hypothetical protein [Phycisphaerales bacterium]